MGRTMTGRTAAVGIAALLALGLTGCSDVDTADDVCEKYDVVAEEIAKDDNPVMFNGEIFDALDNLAKKVKDFEAEPEIMAIGEDMLDMANDDSASIAEVEEMIAPVKDFCASR